MWRENKLTYYHYNHNHTRYRFLSMAKPPLLPKIEAGRNRGLKLLNKLNTEQIW